MRGDRARLGGQLSGEDQQHGNSTQPNRDSRADADERAKQYAIADFDLKWCQRYLVAYIELRTPPDAPGIDPWLDLKSREFREDHNFLDILGRSLATSVIVSYGRPWSNNRGSDGQSRMRLTDELISDMAQLMRRETPDEPLLPFDQALHEQTLAVRNQIVAHSDQSAWSFAIERSERGTGTRLVDPFAYLTLDDARELLKNTQSLRSELHDRRQKALSYPDA